MATDFLWEEKGWSQCRHWCKVQHFGVSNLHSAGQSCLLLMQLMLAQHCLRHWAITTLCYTSIFVKAAIRLDIGNEIRVRVRRVRPKRERGRPSRPLDLIAPYTHLGRAVLQSERLAIAARVWSRPSRMCVSSAAFADAVSRARAASNIVLCSRTASAPR
jgi:hypothetical protein